jgi:hypothetical protein
MKNLLITSVVLLFLTGCNKDNSIIGPANYLGVTPGGCADAKAQNNSKNYLPEKDTLTFSFSGDTLKIFVGFNATCCGQYNSSARIVNDTIFINIITTQPGLCDCICYYTYTFRFSGITAPHYYLAEVDDYLVFKGRIIP